MYILLGYNYCETICYLFHKENCTQNILKIKYFINIVTKFTK